MTQYLLIAIFEDGTVDLCKIQDYGSYVNIVPTDDNTIIVDDFKMACSSNFEVHEEFRLMYPYIEYITIKPWSDITYLETKELKT